MKKMRMIADQTGGRMYSPRKIQELSGIYLEIASDLRVQYQLGYNPSNRVHDGRWREISVKVKAILTPLSAPGRDTMPGKAPADKPGPERPAIRVKAARGCTAFSA